MASKEKSLLSVRLRLLRVASGMNQSEVAELLHVGRSAYTYYELSRSKPDYDALISLAKLFRVSIDYLVGLSNLPERRGDMPQIASEISEQQMIEESSVSRLLPDERYLLGLYRQMTESEQTELLAKLHKQQNK